MIRTLASIRRVPSISIVAASFSSSSSTASSSFDSVGVAGMGFMGHGICQVAAMSGIHDTIIAYEVDQPFLDSGKSRIESSFSYLINKGKLTQDEANTYMNRIVFTTNQNDLSEVDLVVEAVIEDMTVKKNVIEMLSGVCKPEAIFASNTSSFSITEMALASDRPDKFVGLHFFNPVQIMKLVEVISTEHTNADVYKSMYGWVSDIGKVPVSCGDTPGFLVNRLLVPSVIQAMCMIDRRDASVEDIDTGMTLGAGHPMGPLHLADYVGLDTIFFVIEGWTQNHPDEPSFIMPKCLQEKVRAGNLGRKTGEGFYWWDGDKRGNPVE